MFRSTHDVADVRDFLRDRFGDVRDVEPIGGGAWSQAFTFRTADGERVLRLGAYREDYEKDLRAVGFARPGLPVPAVHEIGDAFGGVYAVSTRAYGEGFDGLSLEAFRRLLPSVMDLHAALRSIDVSDTTGYGMWRPDGAAPYATWREFLLDVRADRPRSRIHGWTEKLDGAPGARETFDAGFRLLEASLARGGCCEERSLVHADLMGDNLLCRDGRVTAVVDWANAMYGDFLHDLARMTFFSAYFEDMLRAGIRGFAADYWAASERPVADFEERLRCCELHIGLEAMAYCAFVARLDDLEWCGRRTLEVGARGTA